MAYEIIKGAIAASGDKQDIPLVQDAGTPNRMSFALGFPQINSENKNLGGLPPRRADLNQALYLVTNNLYEFQGGNFPTFNASALTYLPNGGYPLGAILWCAAEGRFLISTVADNTDNFITTPTVIGTSWKFLNDKEVSDCAVGLLLAASTTNVTVGTGFVKSATTGRILNLTSSLSVLWTTIQTNSSITAAANTRYNLFLAYNPTNTTYTILCADYGTFVPTLPTGYVDYGYIGYLSTNNNSAINNIFPQEMDVHQWYRSGGVNADKLARFCVNSGNVDTNGKGDLMSVSGSVVTWKVGNTYPDIVCTPANGLVSFTLSTINNFDASTLSDGTYVLCINKNGVISSHPYIEGNLTYATQKEPASPASGQIWLNMSVSPLNAYQYNGSIWIPFYKVPLGVITVESGSITTYYTLPFNMGNIVYGGTLSRLSMPDYANGTTVSAASGTWTKVNKDSFVVTYGADQFTEAYYVYVSPDNGNTKYTVGYRYDDTNIQTETSCFSFFVPAGWYFANYAENGYTAHIYPLVGAQ